MRFWERIIITTLLFLLISRLLPTMFYVSSFWVALAASLILVVLNIVIKPLLTLLSLPINILTFGLFSFVINGFMLQLTAGIVGYNFHFSSFMSSIIVALIVSVINGFITRRVSRN